MAHRPDARASPPTSVIAVAIAALVALAVVGAIAWLVLRDDAERIPAGEWNAAVGDLATSRAASQAASDPAEVVAAARAHGPDAARARLLAAERSVAHDEAVAPEQDLGDESRRARRIAGIVVDDAGEPIADVHVEVVFDTDRAARRVLRNAPERATAANADGRFELHADEPGASFLLFANSRAHLPAQEVRGRAGGEELRIVLTRPGQLVGLVLTDDGIPRDRLQVFLDSLDRVELARDSTPDPPEPSSKLPSESVGRDGRFRFRHLRPGTFDVLVSARGFGSTECELARTRLVVPPAPIVNPVEVDRRMLAHEVREGRTLHGSPDSSLPEPVDVTIDLRGRLSAVQLHVALPGGEPPPDTLLRVFGASPSDAAVTTLELEDGVATLVTLGTRPDVEIWAPGCRIERLARVSEDRSIVLRPGLARSLNVQVEAPCDLGDLAYMLFLELAPDDPSWPGSLAWLRAGIDVDGRGRLEATSPGRYRVHLRAEQLSPTGARRGPPIPVTSVRIDVDDSREPLDVVVPVSQGELDRAFPPR